MTTKWIMLKSVEQDGLGRYTRTGALMEVPAATNCDRDLYAYVKAQGIVTVHYNNQREHLNLEEFCARWKGD